MHTFPLREGRPVLKILAAAIICALLAIALWPFKPWPKNEVSWLHDEDGLRLCNYGTILSAAQFPNEAGAENKPFSLEFWMVPWRNEGSTVMFAFYVRENPGQFVVWQDGLDVSVSHTTRQREENNRPPLVAEEVIAQNKGTLVTVTAGSKETTLYVNGQAQSSSQSFGLSRKNLAGEFVIGTSPLENKGWCGVLRGIAIYKTELTAQEVAGHYKAWSLNRAEDTIDKRSIIALYLFRERSGTLIRNEIQPGVDLRIPNHYTIRRRNVLLPPWKEFRPEWTYVRDVILNVLGFIPLGLILYPYFLLARGSRRPLLMSYLTGAGLSLIIEILQSFLPMRGSGWTDVITNSAGTALGASLCYSSVAQSVLKRLFGEKSLRTEQRNL
jgi:Concanavalin A-like lectin/glucanases superfamily/VanZ like family